MKLHQTTLPTAEEIARHMGLRDLRIGKHFLRDAMGEMNGCVSVCTLWYAEVVPSFQSRIALGVATATGEPFKDCCTADFVKAVLATPDASHAITIDADPMQTALTGINLFCADRTPSALDGIAYAITFQTMHLQGTLQFGNPTDRCLRGLENTLLMLGEKVAVASDDPKLREVVAAWREFVQDKHA